MNELVSQEPNESSAVPKAFAGGSTRGPVTENLGLLVPEGQMKVAQQFIAGSMSENSQVGHSQRGSPASRGATYPLG
jgi:hypothetical protein